MVKQHLPTIEELLEVMGVRPTSSLADALKTFTRGKRAITDAQGVPLPQYMHKASLKRKAEMLGASESVLRWMIKLMKEGGEEAVRNARYGRGGDRGRHGTLKQQHLNSVSYTHLTLPTNREV